MVEALEVDELHVVWMVLLGALDEGQLYVF